MNHHFSIPSLQCLHNKCSSRSPYPSHLSQVGAALRRVPGWATASQEPLVILSVYHRTGSAVQCSSCFIPTSCRWTFKSALLKHSNHVWEIPSSASLQLQTSKTGPKMASAATLAEGRRVAMFAVLRFDFLWSNRHGEEAETEALWCEDCSWMKDLCRCSTKTWVNMVVNGGQ